MHSQFNRGRINYRGSHSLRSHVLTMAIMILAVILAFAILEAVS